MTNTGEQHAVRAFWDRPAAQAAVAELEAQGFTLDQIGFAVRHEEEPSEETRRADETAERSAEGAVAGIAAGGIIGGLGAAAISLLIPGIGPIVGGGILASVLGGAAIGAGAGGLLGVFNGLGLSDEEAHQYEREFRAGRPIVAVRTDDRRADATEILERHGGYDPATGRTGPTARESRSE